MLSLNSTLINLKALRITVSQELAAKDASGQSSSTATAETGTKAKVLSISGQIAFNDERHLAALWQLAEATDNGARRIYRISNRTADALGIKQVRFSSKIEAAEQSSPFMWNVSFSLTEYHSVPEKKAQREPKPAASQQSAQADMPHEPVHNPEDDVPPDTRVPLTGFAGVLKAVDNLLS